MARKFAQVQLVGAIMKWLARHGEKYAREPVVNAMIAAADGIIAAIDKADERDANPPAPGSGLAAWLATGKSGVSSRYMASVLAEAGGLGVIVRRADGEPWPHDGADFGRCVGLLVAAPELRPHLGALLKPEHGPVWNTVAAHWGALEAWYNEDLPTGKSRRVFDFLKKADADSKPTG